MGVDINFHERFQCVKGEALSLSLIETCPPTKDELPFYWWAILENASGKAIGKISLRLGHNYHSYWNGNVGYEIDPSFQGHHYAAMALSMILPIAKAHGMERIYLTCDEDNVASYKTIERLGGTLLETAIPPKDYIYYQDNGVKKRVYVIEL